MAIGEDLVIPQGKSWEGPIWALLYYLDNGPISLTGKTIRAQVRPSVRDSIVLHEWSTEAGNIAISSVTVTVQDSSGVSSDVTTVAMSLTVHPSVSSGWTWRRGVYDVEIHDLSDPENVLEVIKPSVVTVTPEVTR